MKKLFTERARLVIYLEQSDVQKLAVIARSAGKTLIEWAREVLVELSDPEKQPERIENLGKFNYGIPAVRPSDTSSPRPKRASRVPAAAGANTASGPPVDAKTGKSCVHGKERGYHCWQCGGIAKVTG